MKHKQLLVALVGLIALLLVTGSVYAEGTFSWIGYRLQIGSTSRTWTDKNLDNTSTKITFEGCSHSIQVGLYRKGLQNTRVNSALLHCQVRDSASFGRQPAGDYYFRIERIIGSNTLMVSRIIVEY